MYQREEVFRQYMSDTMQIAYKLNIRYVDILKPIEVKKADEIIKDVVAKGGLTIERI